MNYLIKLDERFVEYSQLLDVSITLRIAGKFDTDVNFNILEKGSLVDLKENLFKFNGFYAIIAQSQEKIIAVVDHVRSIPLFYAQYEDTFYLSDSAEWIRQQLGVKEFNQEALEEFKMAGFVTGNQTLFDGIYQLEAGEFIILNKTSGMIEKDFHFEYLHQLPVTKTDKELLSELDKAMNDSIDHLIEHAQGRQIVIPLSGGYDSRIIALMLKKKQYPKLLSFTYGIPNNRESIISHQVAQDLGIPWHFVEYSSEKWHTAWLSDQMFEYLIYAGNYVSLPHQQDWLAVRELVEKNIVEADAIFVPGHSGDFIAGSHLPEFIFTQNKLFKSTLANEIYRKHYNLNPLANDLVVTKKYNNKLSLQIECEENIDSQKFASYFEHWDEKERQAKFICNSIRVYEFFGYSWWMPLWDKVLVDFFLKIPLKHRYHERLYLDYINKEYRSFTGKSINQISIKKILINNIKNIIPNILLPKVQEIYTKFTKQSLAQSYLALHTRYPVEEYIKLQRNGYQHNGINVYFYVKRIKEFRNNHKGNIDG